MTKLEENVHKLKLARLDWELLERQNMLAKIKELEKHIEQHEQDLKNKQSKLESLQPKLTSILDVGFKFRLLFIMNREFSQASVDIGF